MNARAHTLPPGHSGRHQSPRCHQPVLQHLRLRLCFATFSCPLQVVRVAPSKAEKELGAWTPSPSSQKDPPCWSPRLSKCVSVSAPGAECMRPLCCLEGDVGAPSPWGWLGTVQVPRGLSVCRWEAYCQREAGPRPPSRRKVPRLESWLF